MLLREVFSKVEPFSWVEQSPEAHEAEFMVGEGFYRVTFLLIKQKWYKSDFWNAQFVMVNGKTRDADGNVGFGIEKTGNASTVFGTVFQIMKEFIENAKPSVIRFEAKEANRQKLYAKMLAWFKQPNWQVTQKKGAFEIKIK